MDHKNIPVLSENHHSGAHQIPPHPDAGSSRQAGLLKGRVSWAPGAFAPMTAAEVAGFYGDPESESQWVVKL